MEPTEPKDRWNIASAVVITILLSIISLAFSAGIEFNRIAVIKSHQSKIDTSLSTLQGQVLVLQTTLPVQMAEIQTKLDDISAQIKANNHEN